MRLPLHYIKYIKERGNVKKSSSGDHESYDENYLQGLTNLIQFTYHRYLIGQL